MDQKKICSTLIGLVTFVSFSSGDSLRNDIHHMMYQNFENPITCFRRFNGTHQFGCSSPRSGTFGAVIEIKTQSDLDVLQKAVAGPYMVSLVPDMFNSHNMDIIVSNENVRGVLLLAKPYHRPESFSPDDTCPNRYSTMNPQSNITWNPYGNQFLLRDWPFPIFLVNNPATVKAVLDCASINMPVDQTQLSRALCSLHMKAHMFGTSNSETCIRRSELINFNPLRYCDPMGDQNIYLSFGDVVKQKAKNTIIISARLDTASIFEGTGPGAMSAVAGIATFIATANALSKMLKGQKYDKSIIFTLFNGEAFDYIGSSRVVYDIEKGLYPSTSFPINFDQLMLFIDISQLDVDSDVYLHYSRKDKDAKVFSQNLTNYGTKFKLKLVSNPSSILPPSSLHLFQQAVPNLPGIIITNYKDQFVNKYYNGIYDNMENLKYQHYGNGIIKDNVVQYKLARVAGSLACALFETVTGKYMQFNHSKENAIVELVDEVLHCFLENSNCRLMQSVVSGDIEIGSKPALPLYVGVAQSANRITTLTGLLLASLTSPRENITLKECTNKPDSGEKTSSLIWMNGISGTGECIKTTLKFTPAVSPAFQIEGYDWASRKYSTWTESVWLEIGLVMFIKPSRYQELVTFGSGVSTMILSFLIIYWISHRGQDLFLSQCPVNC